MDSHSRTTGAVQLTSLIATDLDGTLFHSRGVVSERAIAAIHACQAAGMHVTIATARPYLSVKHLLDPRLHSDTYWICSNGALLYRGDRCLYQDALAVGTALAVLRRLYASSTAYVISLEMAGRLFIDTDLDSDPVPIQYADLISTVIEPVSKILVTMADAPHAAVILPELPVDCAVLMADEGRYASISSPTASKETALQVLLDKLSLSFSEVISFGDDCNDVGMIARSGIGVAMSNAIPQVLAVADRVTLSNTEDGVAVVLEELVLT